MAPSAVTDTPIGEVAGKAVGATKMANALKPQPAAADLAGINLAELFEENIAAKIVKTAIQGLLANVRRLRTKCIISDAADI